MCRKAVLPINSITKKKRKDWATTLLRGTQTGKDFVFDDEVSFGLTGPPIFYRKLVHGKQAKNIRKNVDRKGTVGFWGMIGYGYKSQFIRVRETLNVERYAKMLSTEWKRANLSPRNPPVSLVTDNAPWHVGQGGQKIMEKPLESKGTGFLGHHRI
ncbi:hypothetical protein BLNAU_14001 [Blattamonas nauphoetae]|uniref:Tc1-like transposase DDE domain-containing protein n=1 Tax=Blattamonas nauphoetae TaxID=2049346 RepID=A0ABQ9XLL2_9EUKA|nr:hypothetical protein BLNAU_14001 [Blattamonas nauphoetae]